MLKEFPELSDTKASKTAPIAKKLDRLIRAFNPVVIDGTRLSEDFSFRRPLASVRRAGLGQHRP